MTGRKPKRRFAESRKKCWTKAELGLVEANTSLLFASQFRGHLGITTEESWMNGLPSCSGYTPTLPAASVAAAFHWTGANPQTPETVRQASAKGHATGSRN
jgi:hypothetical protein